MARGGLSFEGIGNRQVTYLAGSAIKAQVVAHDRDYVVGMAVAISGNATVDFGADSDPIHGVIDIYEMDGHTGITVTGYAVDVPIAEGATPTAGQVVVVDGEGGVKGVSNSNKLHAPVFVEVDTEAQTATIFLG